MRHDLKFIIDIMKLVLLLVSFLLEFLFISAAPNGVQHFPLETRILNGSDLTRYRFTFLAAITTTTNVSTQFFCGGAYYGREFIITAGQCVYTAVSFSIRLGSVTRGELDPDGVIVTSTNYSLHPGYNPQTLENDIAVIRLPHVMNWTVTMQPVARLPLHDIQPSPDLYLAIFGWGQTTQNGTELVDRLVFGTEQMITNEQCRAVYSTQVKDNMFCAIPFPDANQTTCRGDVGSPVMIWYGTGWPVIVGISSFFSSRGCASLDPSGFTRIYPYNQWIHEHANNDFVIPPFK